MKRIRPHHLLCMHGFIGKGYSDAFAENMKKTIDTIRVDQSLRITFSADDICAACPHLEASGRCDTAEKVAALDANTAGLLGLEEREYETQALASEMKRLVTPGAFETICRECSWFARGICGETIQKRLAKY